MNYASLTALEERMGAQAYAAWLAETPNPQAELEGCEARMLACILPMHPRSEAQKQALARAVYAQLHWEIKSGLPEGVESFSVGSFSAKLEGASPRLCREARAILLGAGLLCREVTC